jgi:hypothetical protein
MEARDHSMKGTIMAASAAGVLVMLTACTSTQNTSTASSTAPPTGQSAASAAPAACPIGVYQATKINSKQGALLAGQQVNATSGGGLTLTLRSDGVWSLVGDKSALTLSLGNVTLDATVDGSASGPYTKDGDQYTFQQEKVSGAVTLAKPVAGITSIDLAQLTAVIAPAGKTTLTCNGSALTVSSDSVDMELARSGDEPGGADATTSAPTKPAGGAPVVISESNLAKKLTCGGSDVVVNGSGNKIAFTDTCGAVTVNGSHQVLTLAEASAITVNGSDNHVTYTAGTPVVHTNGSGNTVTKG